RGGRLSIVCQRPQRPSVLRQAFQIVEPLAHAPLRGGFRAVYNVAGGARERRPEQAAPAGRAGDRHRARAWAGLSGRAPRDGRVGPAPVGNRVELDEHTARMAKAQTTSDAPRHFQVKRRTDNELILFVEERRESWIVYPPRSQYEFLERPNALTVLVEHHPW